MFRIEKIDKTEIKLSDEDKLLGKIFKTNYEKEKLCDICITVPKFKKFTEVDVSMRVNDQLLCKEESIATLNEFIKVYTNQSQKDCERKYYSCLEIPRKYYLKLPACWRYFFTANERFIMTFTIHYKECSDNKTIPIIFRNGFFRQSAEGFDIEILDPDIRNIIIKRNILYYDKIFVKNFDKVLCKDVIGLIREFVGS